MQLYDSPLAKETKKEYTSSLDKKTDDYHSELQSNQHMLEKKLESASAHNEEIINEYNRGEEGIDYIPGDKDPLGIDSKRLR